MTNDNTLVLTGLKARLRRAYERRQEWKLRRLNMWAFLFSALYLAVLCTTIDPAGCRVRDIVVTDSATDYPVRRIVSHTFVAQAILLDSCTWCGRLPDGAQ